MAWGETEFALSRFESLLEYEFDFEWKEEKGLLQEERERLCFGLESDRERLEGGEIGDGSVFESRCGEVDDWDSRLNCIESWSEIEAWVEEVEVGLIVEVEVEEVELEWNRFENQWELEFLLFGFDVFLLLLPPVMMND